MRQSALPYPGRWGALGQRTERRRVAHYGVKPGMKFCDGPDGQYARSDRGRWQRAVVHLLTR
jgi:hypothetical protein